MGVHWLSLHEAFVHRALSAIPAELRQLWPGPTCAVHLDVARSHTSPGPQRVLPSVDVSSAKVAPVSHSSPFAAPAMQDLKVGVKVAVAAANSQRPEMQSTSAPQRWPFGRSALLQTDLLSVFASSQR